MRDRGWLLITALGLAIGLAGCQKDEPAVQPVENEPQQRTLPKYPYEQIPDPPDEPVGEAATDADGEASAQPSADRATEAGDAPVDTAANSGDRPQPRRSYAPADRSVAREYVVQKGDTLQQISRQFYGTPSRWRQIFEANQNKLKNADQIQVGMTLIIP